jgi:hypothetical protein
MKLSYRKLILPAVIGLAVAIAPAVPVLAVSGDSTTKAACSRVTTLSSVNEASLEAHVASLKSGYDQRLAKVAADKVALDQNIATNRAEVATKFATKIADLQALPNLTTAQTQAIATFKTNMQTANATRIVAVDVARTTYRTALTAFVTTQQQSLNSAALTYQTSVKAAFNTAITNCGDGTAITTLRASIKTARETMSTTRLSVKQASDIKVLAATRNDAIQSANKAFATLAAQYSQTLKDALATTTTTTH